MIKQSFCMKALKFLIIRITQLIKLRFNLVDASLNLFSNAASRCTIYTLPDQVLDRALAMILALEHTFFAKG